MDYREAYEKEHLKCADYAERIAQLEEEKDYLQFRLDRIHNNSLWKATAGLRKVMHAVKRQTDRIKNCGGPRGIWAKIKYEQRERVAMVQHGTASFPDEARAKQERETVFDRMVKISILVPLYNTPLNFLEEMIGSVTWQTYQNWELCLADGSDDAHKEVGEYCRRLAAKDSRIKYQKLAKNDGISGNTNECLKLATGEYIGFIDSDDYIAPTMYEELLRAFEKEKNVGITSCMVYQDTGNTIKPYHTNWGIEKERTISADSFAKQILTWSINFMITSKLFKRQFIGNIRFRHERLTEDTLYIFDISEIIEKNRLCMVEIPSYLYYYRMREGSLCADVKNIYDSIIVTFKEMEAYYQNKQRKVEALAIRTYYTKFLINIVYRNSNSELEKRYSTSFLTEIKRIPFKSVIECGYKTLIKYLICFNRIHMLK